MEGQGLGPVPGTHVAEPTVQSGEHAPDATFQGLDLASMIDPCVRYSAVRDGGGRIVDLRYEALNDAAVAYNDLGRAETIGRTLLELFPGHLAAGWFDRYVDVIETGNPLELNDVSYTLERSGGQVRQYELRALPADDGMVLTWRDVTTRYVVQKATADSEQRFRLLAENVTDVVLEVDEHGRILWASPSSEVVVGQGLDALLGTAFADLSEGDDCERILHPTRSRATFRRTPSARRVPPPPRCELGNPPSSPT